MSFDSVEEKIIFEKLILAQQNSNNKTAAELTALSPLPGDNAEILWAKTLLDQVSAHVNTMETTKDNHAFRPLRSARRVIGGAIVFIKRVVRKCLKWYIDPITNQQIEFNRAASASVGLLNNWASDTSGKITDLTQISKNMESSLDMQKKQFLAKLEEMDNKQAEFAQKYEEMQQILNIGNSQISAIQSKIDKLDELNLDIFTEKSDSINKNSFAQTGEDMILHHVLSMLGIPPHQMNYLDLGANHAKELSNTYHFYKKGARGILIEANPELIPELKFYRSGDVILNRCVAEKSGDTVDFYVLNGDGLSTPDKAAAEEFISKNPSLKIERVVSVETISVNDIIENYLVKAPTILNIDIEGNEMAILKSMDFERYRPAAIIIEMIPYRPTLVVKEKNQMILSFMEALGYAEYAFTGINSIFLDSRLGAERGSDS